MLEDADKFYFYIYAKKSLNKIWKKSDEKKRALIFDNSPKIIIEKGCRRSIKRKQRETELYVV